VVTSSAFVEERTKRKVQKAMRDLNYVPNLLAKGLKNKSGEFIALVVREYSREFFTSMIHDFEEFITEHGLTLLLAFIKGNDPRSEIEIIHKLVGRHVDGIILLSPFGNEDSLRSIRHVPMVFFGCYHEVDGIHRVAMDEYAAGRQAADFLASHGHRRVACVTGPKHHFISRRRLDGFRDALGELGIDLPEERVVAGDFEFSSGRAAAARILDQRMDVSAVWFQNDLMALGALGHLQASGVRIPEDVAVMGMDDIAQTEFSYPRLTTIHQPIREMAKAAVDMLLSIPRPGARGKHGHGHEQREVVFAPKLVVRDSAGVTA